MLLSKDAFRKFGNTGRSSWRDSSARKAGYASMSVLWSSEFHFLNSGYIWDEKDSKNGFYIRQTKWKAAAPLGPAEISGQRSGVSHYSTQYM